MSSSQPIVHVREQKAWDELCHELADCHALAIDTEFFRERTFYPIPALLQIADEQTIYLVDVLTCTEHQGFFDILANEHTTILLHSCTEDIEVFRKLGCGPIRRLFDTQIAAQWLRMGLSLSLQNLVKHYTGIELEKGHARTNWLKRPLSEAQYLYAADDVRYLIDIYETQFEQLKQQNRLAEMLEDCEIKAETTHPEEIDPKAYLKVKQAYCLNSVELGRLKAIAEFREEHARSEDKPRKHILKDEQMIGMAKLDQLTKSALDQEIGLPHALIRRYADELIQRHSESKSTEERVINLRDVAGSTQTIKALRTHLSKLAQSEGLPEEVLPSKRWLNQYLQFRVASWYPAPEGWQGWRKALLEEPFDRILKETGFNH